MVRILEKQAEFRTPEDLETIADLMQELQSFRKYSRQMQLSMCRIVRYMKLVLFLVINKKAQLSLTNPRDACEKFARFT